MIKIFQISFLLLWLYNSCFSQNRIYFDSEDITFEIKKNIFIVQGIYYFNSEKENRYSILYPFPTDTIYSKPFNINVIDINNNDTLSYKIKQDSSSIVFSIYVNKTAPILISYEQRLKSNKARYILTTTKHWNKPLNKANYKLVTKQNVNIKNFSMLPDKEIILNDKRIFFWQKENFMPSKDFEIEFQ